jgi:hypothetical protein
MSGAIKPRSSVVVRSALERARDADELRLKGCADALTTAYP